MPTRTVALFLSFTMLVGTAAAEIFTWTDSDGVVHFTDRHPPGQMTETVSPQTPSLMPMNSNLKAADAIQEIVVLPPANRSSTQVGEASRKRQQKHCEGYRKKLKHIQSQLRAGYSNAKGNRLRAKRRDLSGRLSRECILK